MADIPLRTYVKQLDNLIERKQVDEVISHCRHILGLYPKHLDTYRMLGKALLEKGRHGDAADIFQRVLSVMPDDFISHVGMSIVREDEANLDAAIWHMERAFESAPANGAIQQELCRLFGRRDGVVPAKARLTRGALARMYAQGGLYLQAEAELKAALALEADRIDLLTKLADVYWQTDQPAQAAQTSAAVLQKLPYSLEANRILVNVFRAQGRANDAVIYRQRLEALDPYEAFADPAANGAGAARVDAAKVMVARLEYVPGMEDSGSPDWLASIGAKFEESASARTAEAQPDWLSAAGEHAPPAPDYQAYQPGQGSVPDWLKDLDSGPAAVSDAMAAAPPDWLKDTGTPAQTTAAPGASNDNLPDWLVTATGPLPADAVPDWMLEGSTPASPEPAEHGTAPLPENRAADSPTEPAQPKVGETTLVGPSAAPALTPIEPTGAVPDWLKTTVADEGTEELPDWLKAITTQPLPAAQAPATAEATDTIAAGQIPAWLQPAAPEQTPTAATPPVASETVPDWLETATKTPSDTGPLPDWLKVATGELNPAHAALVTPPETAATEPTAALASQAQSLGTAESSGASEIPAGALPAKVADHEEATGLAALPIGLVAAAAAIASSDRGPSVEAVEPPLAVEAAAPAAPAQLASDATGAAAVSDETAAASVAPQSNDELPDWLQTAVAVPAQDETPVWLQTAPAGPSLVEAHAEQEPEPEMPDWLRDLAAGAPPADPESAASMGAIGLTGGNETLAAEDTARPPAVQLPDYLQLASAEAIARAEKPLEMEPEEMEPEEDEPAAALPAEIPDWLKALAPVSPDPSPPGPLTPEAADSATPAGTHVADSLSWLDELTASAVRTDATASTEPAAEEPPAWLAAPAALASNETVPTDAAELVAGGLSEDTLSAEIPPWAQNQEPGPSDTIVSWLAGKHVPDWLRQPANEAPGLPAVEWEPNAAQPAEQARAADSHETAATLPVTTDAAEAPTPSETSLAAAPDLESMDPEAAFRWLESLAAQQGANPEELFTTPAATPAAVTPAVASIVAPTEPTTAPAEPATLAAQAPAAPTPEPAAAASEAVAPEAGGLEDFLKQTEAAMPVEHLLDTAPSKLKPPAATLSAPASETPAPVSVEPAVAAAETPVVAGEATPEPSEADFDSDAAMRWLEGLAAQQGANPEELITAPEDRTLEAPKWVVAEQAAAIAEVQAEGTPPMATEPAAAIEEQEPAPTPPARVEAAALGAEETPAPVVEPVAAQPTAVVAEVEGLAMPVPAAEVAAEATPSAVVEPVAAQPTAEVAEVAGLVVAAEAAAVPEAPVAAAAAPSSDADAEAEAAMRWLEGLAAQQGANPEELLTAPEDRTLETPAWVSAAAEAEANAAPPKTEAAPVEAAAPEAPALAQSESAPTEATVAAEMPEQIETPAVAAADKVEAAPSEPAHAAAAAEPLASGAGADLDKLSRLAERLGAARRAREAEMEARFAEQRSQQEAARRWVEEKLEAKQAEPEPAADSQPVAPKAAEAETVEAAADAPVKAEQVPAAIAAAAVAPAAASRLHPRPSLRTRRPRPAKMVSSPPPAVPAILPSDAAEALARGQAALAGQDYETAVAHLSPLVEQGHHLDTVVQSLESATGPEGRAPAPMLRLLGDAYMRTDQLQKALDTYRQALRRL